jgi:hypothetical protein
MQKGDGVKKKWNNTNERIGVLANIFTCARRCCRNIFALVIHIDSMWIPSLWYPPLRMGCKQGRIQDAATGEEES